MVCGVDDLMVCLAASVSTRADWVVDEAFVGAFEECYRNAKGNFDRRRRPWCTIRRCIKAYRTGRASEFDTLRHYLKEAKDELTEEAQEAATDQATEAFQDLAEKMADWLECLEF